MVLEATDSGALVPRRIAGLVLLGLGPHSAAARDRRTVVVDGVTRTFFLVREDGLPITEHLPEQHEVRCAYGLVTDPTQEQGRALRRRAEDAAE